MTQRECLLGRNPFVGDNSYQSRHKDGHNALHCVKDADFWTESCFGKETAHRCEVGSPHCKLEEEH